MGDVIDFKSAHHEKSHERKQAKANRLKGSFKSAREAAEPKSKAITRLKNLFKNPLTKSSKKPANKNPSKKPR